MKYIKILNKCNMEMPLFEIKMYSSFKKTSNYNDIDYYFY